MAKTTTTASSAPAPKGKRLRSEVRTYIVSMEELSQWLTGGEGFRVTGFDVDDESGEIIVELSNAPTGTKRRAPVRAVEREEPGPQIAEEPIERPRADGWLADGDEGGGGGDPVDDVPSQIPERVSEARARRSRRV